jgi:hypothetical protein
VSARRCLTLVGRMEVKSILVASIKSSTVCVGRAQVPRWHAKQTKDLPVHVKHRSHSSVIILSVRRGARLGSAAAASFRAHALREAAPGSVRRGSLAPSPAPRQPVVARGACVRGTASAAHA